MHPARTAPATCPNCRAALPAEPAPLFCWRCGQETQLHEPTFLEFVHEFVGHYVAVEGALWRSLGLLVAAPGRLTVEYLAGRRRRYVLPLRLYLSASFVFFLVVKVFGSAGGLHIVVAPGGIDSRGHAVTAAANPAEYGATLAEMRRCVEVPGSCSWFATANARLGLRAESLSAHPEVIAQRLLALAPYAVFALLPLFAAIVMLAERARRINYGGHFVFSLHTHAFWFLALTVLSFVPRSWLAWGLAVLPLYALLALHRVYPDGWPRTLLRAAVVAVLYAVALVAAMLLVGIGSVLTG